MEFSIGQRWISHSETQLGLGIVTEAKSRRVKIMFPAVGESRIYAIDTAPLSRIIYSVGDVISNDQDLTITIQQCEQQQSLYIYTGYDSKGQTHSLHEIDVSSFVHFTTPEQRLFSGQLDKNKNFSLRIETLNHLDRLQQSNVKGLLGSRSNLLPHQLYIANKIAQRHAPRVLLADEVGLGKTIEAGMILHHQIITEQAQRVLIIVPDSLIHQWLVEMLRRFNLKFSIYDRERVETLIEEGLNNPLEADQLILCSISLLTDHSDIANFASNCSWDMLIIDEAHHLAWSQDEASIEYQLVEKLSQISQSLLLLTATPEQMGVESHFARLKLLDPARFHDFDSYRHEQENYQQLNQYLDQIQANQNISKDSHSNPLLKGINVTNTSNIIPQLLDQHGTGRVYFRNTRATIDDFPKRQSHAYPLPCPKEYSDSKQSLYPEHSMDPKIWIENDPRVAWLVNHLQKLKPEKVLVICHHAQTAIHLDQYLNLRAGIRSTSFYEDMSIIERDRAAAYFSEGSKIDDEYSNMGAQVMICSEIGSEGRNFQFASHLILFDLSINPDLIEQRIGRLDRIGQKNDIQIHIPYLTNTAQEIIFRWLHDGINLFSRSCSAGQEILRHFSHDLELLVKAENTDKCSLERLVKDTSVFTQKLNEKLQRGRDRLIELNSFDAEQAAIIINDIEAQAQTKVLTDYMESVFDQLGINSEFHSEHAYIIKASEHTQGDLPGLKEDGTTITYDREKALSREDMEFVTWEHPMVSESMSMIINSEFGNTAVATISTNALEKGSLLLEVWYGINVIADKKLQLSRYLPITPTRCLLDNKGNNYSQAISHDLLNPLCKSLPKKTAIAIVNKTKALTSNLLEKAQLIVDKELVVILQKAHDKIQSNLGEELDRLRALQEKNKTIRKDEIEHMEETIQISQMLIDKAQFQVQAIRLIVNS